MYNIREMMDTDWEEVSRIYQEGMDTNLATFQTTTPTYKEFDIGHLEKCRYVITENNKTIGWCALSSVSNRCVYSGVAEVSIYISSNNYKKGIGFILLTHLIEQSEKAGIWTLQSGIMSNNLASIKLHEKCGFYLVGERKKIGKDRFNNWRNTILMEKRSSLSELNN